MNERSNARPSVLVPLMVVAAAIGGLGAERAQAAASPQTTLSKARAELAKARSLRFDETTMGSPQGDTRISGDVTRSGDLDVTVRPTDDKNPRVVGTMRLRAVSGRLFIRGDAAYWGAKGLPSYADRWFRAQAKVERSFAETTDALKIKSIAKCIDAPEATGTLSFGAPTRVGGRRALAIVAAGDRPGSRPRTTLVTTGRRPLPLMITSGPVTPGGPTTDCTSPNSTASSVTRFSRIDRKITIRAPKGAATLPG